MEDGRWMMAYGYWILDMKSSIEYLKDKITNIFDLNIGVRI